MGIDGMAVRPTTRTTGQYRPDGRMLTNIVMMGMGEPLYNFENVRDALKMVMDGDGIALSKRRITLSTSGVVPMMARAGEEIGVNLAVSLHAVRDDMRDEIVPLNRKYPIEELLQACRRLSRRQQRPAHHLRICDAEGQERQRRGCARAGAADQEIQAARQGEPDPVQPLARRALRMLKPGTHPRFSRHHLRCRHFRPGAHPARARHHGGLRPAEDAAQKLSRAELDRLAEEKQAALG
jgi:23S rRNA (adenine2503-C2)-methyltransferase